MSATTLGVKQVDQIDLNRMVHLALSSSPNVGIVNFNILKTFLLELLNALDLQNFEPRFGENNDIKNLLVDAIKNEESVVDDSRLTDNGSGQVVSMNSMFPDRVQMLENKINRLEQQIASLNSIPSSQEIIRKSKENSKTGSSGPILEIWQYTQLSKRQESNEDGITKLTSIIQDLIGEINDFKDFQNKISLDLKGIASKNECLTDILKELDKLKEVVPKMEEMKSSIDYLSNQLGNFEKLNESISDISQQLKDQENKLNYTVTYDDTNKFIKWNDLEGKIQGQAKTQKSQYSSDEIASDDPEFNKCLSNLGTLHDRHENLKDLVDNLRIELGKKNSSVSLPDDFAEKMEELKNVKNSLDELMKHFNEESKNRKALEDLMNKLNEDIESFKKTIKELLENTDLNTKDIVGLKEALQKLEEAKADQYWVVNEIKNKADLKDLNNKMNKKVFDEFNQEISSTVKDLANKDTEIETEVKINNVNVFKELESKLDRLEVDALKDYIEKQMKKLKRLNKEEHMQPNIGNMQTEDDAAGITKQLLRFHCISCARPILINQHGAVPSLPAEKGIRPIQTPRPYTTYELDQIRQYQKQQFMNETSYDLFSTERQCGGSHTLTIPHKKLLKISQSDIMEQSNVEQPAPHPITKKTEVQIQGQDGQIYKGRLDAKLNVEMKRPTTQKQLNRRLKSAPLSPSGDASNKSIYNL